MSRIPAVPLNEAPDAVKEVYLIAKRVIGVVPSLYQSMAASPESLHSYFAAVNGLSHGTLSKREREIIALSVSEHHGCCHGFSGHTLVSRAAGIPLEKALRIHRDTAIHAKLRALVSFVRSVLRNQGRLSDSEIASFKSAGYADAQIIETLLWIALDTFTHTFNNLNETMPVPGSADAF
jgi:AhpD family alkylhydroperoxidase